MEKSTMFQNFLQSLITEEDVRIASDNSEYKETARKFTVHTLLQYWAQAAFEQWNGFRDGADRAFVSSLPQADYSTFSKKAKSVPFYLANYQPLGSKNSVSLQKR